MEVIQIGQPDYDAIVRSANLFNQYLYNRNADQKITAGVAEGICDKEWPLVRQAMEEIADNTLEDDEWEIFYRQLVERD